MKKLVLLAAASMLVVGTLLARPNGRRNHSNYSPETRATMRVDMLAETVELSASERAKVLELFTKQEKEKDVKREALTVQRSQHRAEMDSLRTKTDESLKKIIGEERFAQYEKARGDVRGKSTQKRCDGDSRVRSKKGSGKGYHRK
ncbi:MAG TPA: hypothetical protein PLJ40_02540 [Paludibacteraceae bacterium]|nr:hypothetical protein [Paludibacteraceae bacterium]HQB68802.1 hypothetical protein [Paludibacteraceae bacterium]HRS67414.1 hypothetical protein [Paludibacteraceae bacterium]